MPSSSKHRFSPKKISPQTLTALAVDEMERRGLLPDFPKAVKEQLHYIKSAAVPTSDYRDMRNLPWISIDNIDSQDLDQITYAEGNIVYVAIADVEILVPKDSPIDRYAYYNTSSVYTPSQVFPMLPTALSHHLTSLLPGEARCAIVSKIEVSEKGEFQTREIFPAWVRNHAKLVYEEVSDCLENKTCLSQPLVIVEQISLQNALASKILSFRNTQGNLEFGRLELEAIVSQELIALRERKSNPAHRLIENLMIATNVGVTYFLKNHKRATLQRIVQRPKRWNRIVEIAYLLGFTLPHRPQIQALRQFLLEQKQKHPTQFSDLSLVIIKLLGRGEYEMSAPNKQSKGHFDLALREYAHTTAPNRRYPDLVMQRLLKSILFKRKLPYSQKELKTIAKQCTKQETSIQKVERKMLKCAAAMLLSDRLHQHFQAIVTGHSRKGTWIRLIDPPVEGRLTHGAIDQVDVGHKVEVELVRVNVEAGHLDFKYSGLQ